jgi:DNA-binding MarR family transcriptional regulator
MPKRSILQTNNNKLTSPNNIDDKIFDYLRSHMTDSSTQSKIASEINVDRSTVSRHIEALVGQKKLYGDYFYHIERVSRRYQMFKTAKDANIMAKLNEFDYAKERLECRIYDLAQQKVCSSNTAELLPAVILYRIKKNSTTEVTQALFSTFSSDVIQKIIPSEEGLYIILKSQSDRRELSLHGQQICQFYEDIVKQMELQNNKRMRQSSGKNLKKDGG